MELSAEIVGAGAGPLEQSIDARWLMAYSAGLGESAPEYMDTARPGGVLAHPLFPVCYEWPLAVDMRATLFGDAVSLQSVHATHDLVLHRLPRAGDRLITRAEIIGAENRPPGAYVVTRFQTLDASGAPVSTTDYGSIYRGVKYVGDARRVIHDAPLGAPERRTAGRMGGERGAPHPPLSPEGRGAVAQAGAAPAPVRGEGRGEGESPWSATIPISPTLAHVYTECARIWNPVHTDRAVALGAGLPDIILHGTATLALAVSAIVARKGAGAAARVRSVACRFSGMVRLPSTITVEAQSTEAPGGGGLVAFRVRDDRGNTAVRDGAVALD